MVAGCNKGGHRGKQRQRQTSPAAPSPGFRLVRLSELRLDPRDVHPYKLRSENLARVRHTSERLADHLRLGANQSRLLVKLAKRAGLRRLLVARLASGKGPGAMTPGREAPANQDTPIPHDEDADSALFVR